MPAIEQVISMPIGFIPKRTAEIWPRTAGGGGVGRWCSEVTGIDGKGERLGSGASCCGSPVNAAWCEKG